MTITVVFDPPLPSDSPSTFNTKAFTLLGDLNTWSTQANALPASVASNVSAVLAAPTAIGSTTPSTGAFTTLSATGSMGYVTGAGGTVNQATSKGTTVSLHKPCGQITMFAALTANEDVVFQVNNSMVAANDIVFVQFGSSALQAATVEADVPAANYFRVRVKNLTASTLGSVLVIKFAVIKGATS